MLAITADLARLFIGSNCAKNHVAELDFGEGRVGLSTGCIEQTDAAVVDSAISIENVEKFRLLRRSG
jgi:hypothetical protein